MKRDPYEPAIGNGTVYLKAVVFCSCCSSEKEVILGKDKAVYHECNQRNKKLAVPTLEEFLKGKF